MRHPFDFNQEELQNLDLDSLQDLTDRESESIGGGMATSQTLTAVGPGESGESGGGIHATTFAAGAEAGEGGGGATTLALGEEGGSGGGFPISSWPGTFPCDTGNVNPL